MPGRGKGHKFKREILDLRAQPQRSATRSQPDVDAHRISRNDGIQLLYEAFQGRFSRELVSDVLGNTQNSVADALECLKALCLENPPGNSTRTAKAAPYQGARLASQTSASLLHAHFASLVSLRLGLVACVFSMQEKVMQSMRLSMNSCWMLLAASCTALMTGTTSVHPCAYHFANVQSRALGRAL